MDDENKPLLLKPKADGGFSRILDSQAQDYINVLNPQTADYTSMFFLFFNVTINHKERITTWYVVVRCDKF